MKLTSKYFDSIRVKPEDDRSLKAHEARCQWRGCDNSGKFPAPKGRDQEGEYYLFCQSHVREYNKKYNYFSGMEADDIVDYQKSASTGHRPTWSFKDNPGANKTDKGSHGQQFEDPFHFFDEDPEEPLTNGRGRHLRKLERKSLGDLGLSVNASKDDIKARYKELVKRHHPDLNGGDRNSEDKLREVIAAYNYLKKVGLV